MMKIALPLKEKSGTPFSPLMRATRRMLISHGCVAKGEWVSKSSLSPRLSYQQPKRNPTENGNSEISPTYQRLNSRNGGLLAEMSWKLYGSARYMNWYSAPEAARLSKTAGYSMSRQMVEREPA